MQPNSPTPGCTYQISQGWTQERHNKNMSKQNSAVFIDKLCCITIHVEAGNICSVTVSFVRVGSQLTPRRTRKDSKSPPLGEQDQSNAPPQGRQRQSNPHPIPCPLHPPTDFTLISALISPPLCIRLFKLLLLFIQNISPILIA